MLFNSCNFFCVSVILISCVFWIFFQKAGSHLCFRLIVFFSYGTVKSFKGYSLLSVLSELKCSEQRSTRAHYHLVGMLQWVFFFFYINQLSMPTPFYSVLVFISALMILSTVFHSINSPDCFFTLFFRSYFCRIGPFNYILYESPL